MAKKLLITGGCSYTDAKYKCSDPELNLPEAPWAMWPEHLGNQLDLEVINTASSGNGNSSIFHSVINSIYMYGDRVDTVAVLWSGMDRIRTFCGYNLNPINEARIDWLKEKGEILSNPFDWMRDLGLQSGTSFYTSEGFWKVSYGYVKSTIEDSLREYLTLAEICEARNIKFICAQGLQPFMWEALHKLEKEEFIKKNPNGYKYCLPDKNTMLKLFLNNPAFSAIDKNHRKKFIGWPFFEELGGKNIDSMRYNGEAPFYKEGSPFVVSKQDQHPNEEAQKLISDLFSAQYLKNYG